MVEQDGARFFGVASCDISIGMAKRQRKLFGKPIGQVIRRPGAFRRKAQRRGLTTGQFARKVLTNPERYDTRTVRQARLAKTLMGMARRRKR